MTSIAPAVLYAADQYLYAAYLCGNNIPYRHHSIGHHLAVGSSPLRTWQEVEAHLPHSNGLFGHVCYEAQRSTAHPPRIALPEVHFFTPDKHFDLEKEAISALEWASTHTVKPTNTTLNVPSVKCSFTRERYIEAVEKVRQHIKDGDCYELNLCMEFSAEQVTIDPVDVFLRLNAASPMPFAAFYKHEHVYLLCASPERFLKRTGNTLVAQPIKGTIRKGATAEENEQLKEQLRSSEKERAENLMIVDLMRNDLARSAVPGSVKVEELFGIYDFARVNQMISTVTATAKEHLPSTDVFRNAFPMGSMTGAPKVKVMQLIDQYEPVGRGIYSGSVGYLLPNGDMDFNVVIRSIVYDSQSKQLTFHVGSAITYDAVAEDEYDECLLKASAIMEVLGIR